MVAPRTPADPPRTWTVAELLHWTEDHFRKLSFPASRLDAEVLLADALGCSRLDLYTGYRKVVEPDERARFRDRVTRRSRGEPVAYIVGYREFHSLRFEVGPAVLIPRPETEHLVDAAVEHLVHLSGIPAAGQGGPPGAEGPPPPSRTIRALDLGTGSGNIAVSLAVEVPGLLVVAVEASNQALEIARKNAAAHGVAGRIEFLQGSLFDPLATRDSPLLFDAILSNPPYIPPRDRPGLPRDVRDFEPEEALFDRLDGDGLGFHRMIARRAPPFLAPGSLLALEVGIGQAAAVESLFREAGLRNIRTVPDLGGIPRVVLGENPEPMNSDPPTA
jgi:release factor glutamine methyltransferase